MAHAQRDGALPHPHGDPFDRMLAAQSLVGNVPVVGNNEALRRLGAELVW